jgi:inner membrane protein
MPLPIAHSLAGVAAGKVRPLPFFEKKWMDYLFLICLSNAADLDFLPGFLLGTPSLYHHGVSHSLGAALVVGFFSGGYFKWKRGNYWKYFAVTGLVYYFHIILDSFTEDTRFPYGVMLFWPLCSDYFTSGFILFGNVVRSDQSHNFFQSLCNAHNLMGAFRELWVMGGLIGMIQLLKLFFR